MREKLTSMVAIRFPFEAGQRLGQLAQAQGTDKSKLVRQIVLSWIKNQKDERPGSAN